ncbi:N-acetylglucosamine kinase [Cryobacterium sp. Y29]|uniref:N-acetylglucosamine kinase n=1 Tax=Cryobacterium sp. Y29 TaxID=2048285 RepID=UPI000CE37FD9|nr:BadF/BadG/BcrA/BcrD ATPase family protein [Cryobacterium sp. Y29]
MYVGIDIGGTKTHTRVEANGETVLDTTVLTSSWRRGGLLDDVGNATRLLGLFATVPQSDTAPLALGAHGLDSAWQCAEFEARLTCERPGPVRAVNDVELVGPAAGYDTAIAVIAGTGSRIVAHDVTGAVVSAGGYGHFLGDPGSAPALARDAVRAVLWARDEGCAPGLLSHALMEHFGVDDEVAMSYEFAADSRLTTWGALAPLLFTAADAGSRLAATVVDEAARELATAVGLVRSRGAVGTDIVCAGGVISNQPRLFGALERHIANLDRTLTLRLLQVAPVAGAIAIARRMHPLQIPITNQLGETRRNT